MGEFHHASIACVRPLPLLSLPSLLHFHSGNFSQLFSAKSNNFRDDCRPCQNFVNRSVVLSSSPLCGIGRKGGEGDGRRKKTRNAVRS